MPKLESGANLPRIIAPENIEVGDKIKVTFPPVKGVRMTHEGVVSERRDQGAVRTLYTDEGGTLIAWEPGKRNLSVMLLDRPPVNQTQLSLFDTLEDRLA